MAENVVFHVRISQTVVGLLFRIALDCARSYSVVGIILADGLKVELFLAAGVLHPRRKRFVHFDNLLVKINLQSVFHYFVFLSFFCWFRLSDGHEICTTLMEILDFRILVQEPSLDFSVGEGFRTSRYSFITFSEEVLELGHSGSFLIVMG